MWRAAALARWDELPLSHYWAAHLAAKPEEQIAHYRRAIELDETQAAAWQALARIYRQRRDEPALLELRHQHRWKLKKELPADGP